MKQLYVQIGDEQYRTASSEEVIEAALQLSTWEYIRGEEFTSVEKVRRYLKLQLSFESEEVFSVLFLDNRHRSIAFEKLFRGTIDGCSVHPRVVVRRALELNAAAIILAHNHPSGVAEASAADCQITSRLRSALEFIDVRLLDHIIVGEDEPVSLAERGLL